MEFWKEAAHGILAVLPGIILFFLPLLMFVFLRRRGLEFEKLELKKSLISICSALVIHLFTLICMILPGLHAHSPYDIYHNNFQLDLSMEKLGVITSVRLDFVHVIFGNSNLTLDQEAFVNIDLPTITPVVESSTKDNNKSSETDIKTFEINNKSSETNIKSSEINNNFSGNKNKSLESRNTYSDAQTLVPTPTPFPVDTSPNVLNIDFKKLAENEENNTIKTLHSYFSEIKPTNKNKFTGMFKDYNLIFITAEGFSPWAVDKELTPTLYQMIHEGFEFNNFYTPIWYTSTSDGEYVACTGLLPSGTNSFSKSSDNALPFSLGWRFQNLNYSTRAYHNHSYTYYNRNLTHPNMGYDFKAPKGGGLEIELTWPESDVEMMNVTVPEFIKDEKFHVYYMTVSGHLEYTFAGNYISKKNQSFVEHLPYSANVKAYKACQLELEYAMKNLIKQLESAGVLENTVIALSADHYPYGLTNEEISEAAGHKIEENFELYKNHFILWNSTMEGPVVVDKYCSSLDIMPTLCNLFGLPYDSRLFMGQDILSDASPLIIFGNQSFITEHIMYNSKTREVIKRTDVDLPKEYVKKYTSIVRNKFNVSESILMNDYFSYLLPYLDWEVEKK